MIRVFAIVAVTFLLSACGERDQSLTATASKSDTAAFKGVSTPYLEKGWKPGDKTSWENQIRMRGQHQNEYTKTN